MVMRPCYGNNHHLLEAECFSRGSFYGCSTAASTPKIRFQKVSWCGSESIYYTSLEFDLFDLHSPLAAWCCPLGSSSDPLSKAKNVRDPQSTLLLKKRDGEHWSRIWIQSKNPEILWAKLKTFGILSQLYFNWRNATDSSDLKYESNTKFRIPKNIWHLVCPKLKR